MCWNQISSQADIDNLIKEYYGFHDSCIVSVHYISSACVDEGGFMCNINENCSLIIQFDSQMPRFYKKPEKKSLELKFTGLRRLNLIGFQQNYFCNISSCFLSFYNNLIIWSDNKHFNPDKYQDNKLLDERMDTFIIAKELSWRFI